jgi:hypothetical protein
MVTQFQVESLGLTVALVACFPRPPHVWFIVGEDYDDCWKDEDSRGGDDDDDYDTHVHVQNMPERGQTVLLFNTCLA